MSQRRYFLGLDLGQTHEFTALAVVERLCVPDGAPPDQRRPAYVLRHLHRFPLGTPYPEVIGVVRKLLQTPPLPYSLLLVDQTGVGRAVVELLKDGLGGRVDCTFWPVTLSVGHEVVLTENGKWLLPKKELVGVLQVLLQTRRILIPRTLPDAGLLVRELENFQVRATLAREDTVEAWREGQDDDLVFAVALAAWAGEQALPPLVDPPPEPEYTQVIVV